MNETTKISEKFHNWILGSYYEKNGIPKECVDLRLRLNKCLNNMGDCLSIMKDLEKCKKKN